ncbi:hypothetical protein LQZ19_10770 [Treponema primitia]|uniref:hypothetical protein n=1 Tax=Treponema primitia TaxID=88058 RepID=UPI0039816B26
MKTKLDRSSLGPRVIENNVFKPKTEFGKKLRLLRSRAIAEGMILKSCDEILAEIEVERQS